MIVPVPVASERLALLGSLRVTVNVSSASSTVSPVTATSKVFKVWPAAKVSVPLPAV